MRENLIQFFVRPGSGRLRAQVVEYQDRRFDGLEENLVVLRADCRVEGRSQMIEQVGYRNKSDRLPTLDQCVTDCRGQLPESALFYSDPLLKNM